MAAIFGIEDRGVLREGAYADIDVIGFANLAMELPSTSATSPWAPVDSCNAAAPTNRRS
ncbi:MAG: hypothetical protein OXG71_06780 [Rhodospirillales bacterium]|nr:hypothetical protein [Rhodospirillales bacterium]